MFPANKWPRHKGLPPGGMLIRYFHTGMFPAHPWLDGHLATVQLWRGNVNQPIIIRDVQGYPLYTPAIDVVHHHITRDVAVRDELTTDKQISTPQLMFVSDGDMDSAPGRSWQYDIKQIAVSGNIPMKLIDRITHNMAPSLMGRDVGTMAVHGGLMLDEDMDKGMVNFLQAVTYGWPKVMPGVAMALILAINDSEIPLRPIQYQTWMDMDELAQSQMRRATRKMLDPEPFAHVIASQKPPWA